MPAKWPFRAVSRDERLAVTADGARLVFVEYARDSDGVCIPPHGYGRSYCRGCAIQKLYGDFSCISRVPGRCGAGRKDRAFGYWLQVRQERT